ncbi:hypothetical protein [Rufibacter sp. LB8]|uniref:hypothetical protein n=1 Tax=Rufibacter sp. LB8 TaxID=2777781 RepID=UPI00178C5D76|nr:hypothetical protein [Rufibacter sp. LB8]
MAEIVPVVLLMVLLAAIVKLGAVKAPTDKFNAVFMLNKPAIVAVPSVLATVNSPMVLADGSKVKDTNAPVPFIATLEVEFPNNLPDSKEAVPDSVNVLPAMFKFPLVRVKAPATFRFEPKAMVPVEPTDVRLRITSFTVPEDKDKVPASPSPVITIEELLVVKTLPEPMTDPAIVNVLEPTIKFPPLKFKVLPAAMVKLFVRVTPFELAISKLKSPAIDSPDPVFCAVVLLL